LTPIALNRAFAPYGWMQGHDIRAELAAIAGFLVYR
jgi:hypothetical protein